jgi:ribose 5-phosphate isomerase B
MRICVGSDHAGFELKRALIDHLVSTGNEVIDAGTDSAAPVDYPPICAAVAKQVADGDTDVGIVIGGSGQGEQIAANKVNGIRAALCNDTHTARLSRARNDANVLAIGARIVASALAVEIVEAWLTTPFDGGRHATRIEQIHAIEKDQTDRA